MKKTMFGIGSALTVGALLAVAGCSTKVMKDEGYIPLKDEAPAPLPAARDDRAFAEAIPVAATEAAPAPAEAAPAPAEAAAPRTFPRFDSSSIAPVKSASKHQVAAVKPGAVYVVKSGDTLSQIAVAHRVRLADLKQINSLTGDRIRVGQKLTIPAGGKAPAAAAAAAAKKSVKEAAAPALAEGGIYVIKAGDNIPKIAKRFGVKASELQKANNLSDEATRRLQIGQKLVIPGKGAAAAAATANKTAAPAAASSPEVSQKTAAAADDAINALPENPPAATTPAAAPAAAAEAPAEIVPTDVAPAAAQEASDELEPTVPDYIAKGVRLGDYLQQKNISLETFKKYNPSALTHFSREGDNELDAVAADETGVMVFIPGK